MGKRTFTDSPAVRSAVPLLVGLVGPSGSGKTYSALRLATGMQRVTGGEIYVIDTESGRSLAYAELFKFRHVPFAEPFGPLDYVAAIDHCVKAGAKIVVIDSMSHEHVGPGGYLSIADSERKAGKKSMAIWARPKAEREQMISYMLRSGVSLIFCFRAKEKTDWSDVRKPRQLGWQATCGDELPYEMSATCLLPPGSQGTPQWQPGRPGEQMTIKCPRQFDWLREANSQLTEDAGERMAKWAAGADQPAKARDWQGDIANAPTIEALEALGREARDAAMPEAVRKVVRTTYKTRLDQLREATQSEEIADAFEDAP